MANTQDDARDQVEEFRGLVRQRTAVAGNNGLTNTEVRGAARSLLTAAKTNPALAREINSLKDKEARLVLLQVRESQANKSVSPQAKAYMARAGALIANISDPSRKAQAEKLFGHMSEQLASEQNRTTTPDRSRERDFEATQ